MVPSARNLPRRLDLQKAVLPFHICIGGLSVKRIGLEAMCICTMLVHKVYLSVCL